MKMIKWTEENLVSYLLSINYNFIDKEYIKSRLYIIFKDDNYYYKTTLNSILAKSEPRKFHISNPYTLTNIRTWCVLNNKPFELISDTYKSSQEYMQWKCLGKNCGEIFEMSWNSILSDRGCSYCSGKKVGISNCLATKNPELAAEWHTTLNGDLTPYDVTCGSNKEVWWQCSKNPKHIWDASIYNRAEKNEGCPYCSDRLGYKLPSEDYNLLVCNPELCEEWDYEKNDKRPEDYTPKANQEVWWKCKECGNEWKTYINNRSRGYGCKKCYISKGEKFIKNFFEINNIPYEFQKTFNELIGVGNGLLSYDFFIPNFNLLIEYQGEFHDGTARQQTENEYKIQQEHDRRKREYAKVNNYKLLEIWYWDFDKIEKILDKELKLKEVI